MCVCGGGPAALGPGAARPGQEGVGGASRCGRKVRVRLQSCSRTTREVPAQQRERCEARVARTAPEPPPRHVPPRPATSRNSCATTTAASMSVLALQEYEFERQFNEDEAIRWMQENW